MNIWKEAAKKKVRFICKKGSLSAEDLFDLPLTTTVATRVSLNDIAIDIAKKLRDMDVITFVDEKPNPERKLLQLKLEIIKEVIEDKKLERDKAKALAEKKRKKELLMELIEKKKLEELSGKDTAELEKMLKELED